jgi:hypothetical protein
MGFLLLAYQYIWQPRARLSKVDVLMREERGRSEDCLPIRRQMLLPANKLAPGQGSRDQNKAARPCLQVKQDPKPP